MSNLFTDLQVEQEKQKRLVKEQEASPSPAEKHGEKKTLKKQSPVRKKPTPKVTRVRQPSRSRSRDRPRGKSRALPTRDEIQEFSFRLRDELKVKVQAEVPHRWQKELAEIARELDVRKLELYRFIYGEFLGKVRRKKES